MQSFQQTVSALSWPVDNMAKVAEWRASVERVLGLVKALEDLEQEIVRPDPNRIVLEKDELPILTFEKLCISKFNGDAIIACIDTEIRLGERVLIHGDATLGAKLFKAIAGLWPWGHGRIILPDDDPMFLCHHGLICQPTAYAKPFVTRHPAPALVKRRLWLQSGW